MPDERRSVHSGRARVLRNKSPGCTFVAQDFNRHRVTPFKDSQEAKRLLDQYRKVLGRYDKIILRAKRRKQPLARLLLAKTRMLEVLAQKRRDVIWAEDRERFALRSVQAAE